MRRVIGCASVFGVKFNDNQGDRYLIDPDAKIDVIRPLPVLFRHDEDRRISTVSHVEINRRGIWVEFPLPEIHGDRGGMSIGFRRGRLSRTKVPGFEVLGGFELTEVSIVPKGGNRSAMWMSEESAFLSEDDDAWPWPETRNNFWDFELIPCVRSEIADRWRRRRRQGQGSST